jgi:hypothetical protein
MLGLYLYNIHLYSYKLPLGKGHHHLEIPPNTTVRGQGLLRCFKYENAVYSL